jgi:hypothetical protein
MNFFVMQLLYVAMEFVYIAILLSENRYVSPQNWKPRLGFLNMCVCVLCIASLFIFVVS